MELEFVQTKNVFMQHITSIEDNAIDSAHKLLAEFFKDDRLTRLEFKSSIEVVIKYSMDADEESAEYLFADLSNLKDLKKLNLLFNELSNQNTSNMNFVKKEVEINPEKYQDILDNNNEEQVF